MGRRGLLTVVMSLIPASMAWAGGGCDHDCRVLEPAPVHYSHAAPIVTEAPVLVSYMKPPQYGTVVSRELVRPAYVHNVVTPPERRVIERTVVVRPATVSWERRRDHWGRMTLCRVEHPAVRRTIREEVIVPGQRYTRIVPPAYRYVERTVQIRPPEVVHSYVPAAYTWQSHQFHTMPAAVIDVRHGQSRYVDHGSRGYRHHRHWRHD